MSSPILRLRDFGLRWGQKLVLKGLDLEVAPAQVLVLLGPGGGGKSSLLRALSGVRANELQIEGEATYLGAPLGEGPRPSLVGQNPRGVVAPAREALVEGLPNRSALTRLEQRQVIEAALEEAGVSRFTPMLGTAMFELPSPVQRCLRIVLATLSDPGLVMIDEPTAGLDDAGRGEVVEVVRRVAKRRAVLLVTHDRRDAMALGGETALLAGGRVQEQAPTERFFSSPFTEAGKTYVLTGGCALPSPGASPEDLDPAFVPEAPALQPRGFRWVLPKQLGGLPRPGLLSEAVDDLRGLAKIGVRTLVSLEEHRSVPVEALRSAGIESLWFPIADMGTPEAAPLAELCEQIDERVRAGSAVAVHCRAGLGRTGTVIAAYLIWRGKTPAEALLQVRTAQPRSVETEGQEAFLREFSRLAPALREARSA